MATQGDARCLTPRPAKGEWGGDCNKCDNCMEGWRKQRVQKYDKLYAQPGWQSVVRFAGMTQQSIDAAHQYIYTNYVVHKTSGRGAGLKGAYIIYPPGEATESYNYTVIFAEGLSDELTHRLKVKAKGKGWRVDIQRNLTVTRDDFASMLAVLPVSRMEWNTKQSDTKNTTGFWLYKQGTALEDAQDPQGGQS